MAMFINVYVNRDILDRVVGFELVLSSGISTLEKRRRSSATSALRLVQSWLDQGATIEGGSANERDWAVLQEEANANE
jgi:hypothetical protein